MIRIVLVFFVLCSLSFFSLSVRAQDNKSIFEQELEELSNLRLLPQYRENTIVAMESSYDRTEGNDDGFSGKYSFIKKEGEARLVIAELEGPGVIQRIWTPTPTYDTIQFYFDGETEPRINIPFMDLFTGNVFPFINPIVGNEVGGFYCYLPIPYREKCKIVYLGERIQFHQIQHRKFNDNTKQVQSFSMDLNKEETEMLRNTANLWEIDDPRAQAEQTDLKVIKKEILIRAGETIPIAEFKEGARILGIEFDNASRIADDALDLIFRATWDKEEAYAINAPLKHLFGYAFKKPAMRSLLIGTEKGTNYINFPMPFDNHALLDLVYLRNEGVSQPDVRINISIAYLPEKRNPETEGKFYTCWRREKPTIGEPYMIFKHTGKGHYTGTILMCQGIEENLNGNISTIFFEGDDITTIDGSMRMHGTGSEDYFNGGWYAVGDRWDKAFSLPLHGCLGYSIPLARTGGYRFLVGDKETFEEDFSLSIEHGPVNNNWKVDYASVAFYYGEKPSEFAIQPTAELSATFGTPGSAGTPGNARYVGRQ